MNFVCKYLLCPRKVVHGPRGRLGPPGIETLALKAAFPLGCVRQDACEEAADAQWALSPVRPFVSRVIHTRASRANEAAAHSSLTPEMKGGAGTTPMGTVEAGLRHRPAGQAWRASRRPGPRDPLALLPGGTESARGERAPLSIPLVMGAPADGNRGGALWCTLHG